MYSGYSCTVTSVALAQPNWALSYVYLLHMGCPLPYISTSGDTQHQHLMSIDFLQTHPIPPDPTHPIYNNYYRMHPPILSKQSRQWLYAEIVVVGFWSMVRQLSLSLTSNVTAVTVTHLQCDSCHFLLLTSSIIGVTEPRRVAAVTMSGRIAKEMNLSTR